MTSSKYITKKVPLSIYSERRLPYNIRHFFLFPDIFKQKIAENGWKNCVFGVLESTPKSWSTHSQSSNPILPFGFLFLIIGTTSDRVCKIIGGSVHMYVNNLCTLDFVRFFPLLLLPPMYLGSTPPSLFLSTLGMQIDIMSLRLRLTTDPLEPNYKLLKSWSKLKTRWVSRLNKNHHINHTDVIN